MSDKVKEPKDKGLIRVLVYGTLKEGHSNHGLLKEAGAQFIGYDSVTGPYKMYDLGAIPAVVDVQAATESNRKIRGELWAVGPEGLAALDLLEGHPRFYARRKLWTDIHKRRAWMYFLMAPNYINTNSESKQLGLWHGSSAEHKFWLMENKGKAA